MPSLPAAFHVATPSHPRSPAADDALLSSFSSRASSRLAAHAGPATLAAQLDLVERLSAGAVPREELRQAAGRLGNPGVYADLLAERHAAGLCPYAACGNPAAEPYAAAAARTRVRMRGGALASAEGREGDKGAFCSRRCRARSDWLLGELVRRANAAAGGEGSAGEVQLLEDVEVRRADDARSTAALRARPMEVDAHVEPASKDDDPATRAFRSELLDSLAIHERPTPAAAPRAPSLSAPMGDFERPLSASAAPARGAHLPLTGATAFLGRTVPRTLPAPPAPPPLHPPRGFGALPPPRFVTAPVMLDPASGAAVDWAGGVGDEGMELGMNEEEVGWMREALRVREEARGRGEVE